MSLKPDSILSLEGGLVTLEQATLLLRNNEVVGIPTETVYGLAARAQSDVAVRKVFDVKGRPPDNPLIVHVHSLDHARDYGILGEVELLLAHRFWPGPLTLVVPHRGNLPRSVTAGLDTVALRMPQHMLTLDLIAKVGEALVAPSANPSGRPSPTTAVHVLEDYHRRIPVLDGGPCTIGVESTVIRIVHGSCMILRPGAVTADDIASLGVHVDTEPMTEGHAAHSPGTRYRHYAPTARVLLFDNVQDLHHAVSDTKRQVVLSVSQLPYTSWRELSAATLYAELRNADALAMEEILVLCDGFVQRDAALMDRLQRASWSGNRGQDHD